MLAQNRPNTRNPHPRYCFATHIQRHNLAFSPGPSLAMSPATFLEIQSEIAMFVTIGFTPLALGNTLASLTYRPSVPQTRPRGSTTPVLSDALIRLVPIWWAEANVATGGLLPWLSSSASQALKRGSATPTSETVLTTSSVDVADGAAVVVAVSSRMKGRMPGSPAWISIAPWR